MGFRLKGTSRVCRGRHGKVGIVEFGLYGIETILRIGPLYSIIEDIGEMLLVPSAALL